MKISPAEICGVADRVGSIENGKIANRKKYSPAETAAPGGRGGATATDDPGPGGNQ